MSSKDGIKQENLHDKATEVLPRKDGYAQAAWLPADPVQQSGAWKLKVSCLRQALQSRSRLHARCVDENQNFIL